MDLGLRGKKAIITGGSRGIGRATAEYLADEGVDVGFCSRDAGQVAEAQKSLQAKGIRAIGRSVDLTDSDAYKSWVGETADALGGADIFIHCASASGTGIGDDWELALKIDVKGAVIGVQTLEPHLEKSGQGSVVFLTSTAATETFFVPQALNAMKAPLVTYGKQLSQAWGPKNIRVNCVAPGPVQFPGGNWEKIQQTMPDFYNAVIPQMPFGRLGSAEEIARAIAFIASPAASWITGVHLVVDGGYTKRVQL